MTIEFQYTFYDLKEAAAAHQPKPAATADTRKHPLPIIVGIALAMLFLVLPLVVETTRPLFLDLFIPAIAIIVLVGPIALYRKVRSDGIKGLFRGGALRSSFGWILFLTLCLALWSLLRHRQGSQEPDPDALGFWKTLSDILLPHATWLVLAAFLCWFIFQSAERQLQAAWKNSTSLRRPYTMTVTDDTITFAEPLARHELKWFAFDRIAESQNLFLLYLSDQTFHMVPKRAFADARQVDEFRAMIDNRITRRPTAFPVLPVAG